MRVIGRCPSGSPQRFCSTPLTSCARSPISHYKQLTTFPTCSPVDALLTIIIKYCTTDTICVIIYYNIYYYCLNTKLVVKEFIGKQEYNQNRQRQDVIPILQYSGQTSCGLTDKKHNYLDNAADNSSVYWVHTEQLCGCS